MGWKNFGWLAFWVLSSDCLRRKSDYCKALRWGRSAWEEERGPCSDFASFIMAFALQLRKITKTPNQVAEKRSADQRWTHFVCSTWPLWAMASNGLLASAALGSRFGWRSQTSVSVSICRVAMQGGSPRHLTLSRSSQSGHWCVRQTAEHLGSRVCPVTYVPGSPVARRTHLECNNCSIRAWERTADLQAGHALCIMGRMSC